MSVDIVRYGIPPALAALEHDRHHVIEASAGTGKTFLIEHRVVDLVLRGGVTIDRILVVTFTEKATAELRARIRALLARVAAAAEHTADADQPHWRIDARARQRLAEAMLAFDRAPVHTIHGFCQKMLTEHAFANRRLFEQNQVASAAAFADAFTAALRERFACDATDQRYLCAWLEQRSLEALRALLFDCAMRGGELRPVLDEARLIDARAACAAALAAVESDFEARLKAARVHGNTRRALSKRLEAAVEVCAAEDPLALIAALARHKDDPLAYLAEKLADAAAPALTALQAAAARLSDAAVPLEAAIAQRFLPEITGRMRTSKDRRGLFDFQDMLELVWQSLDGPAGGELAAHLRQRFPHALIDEFQDTDEVQWQIFRRVYLESDGGHLLCIIGDPKQAIYGFRGADVHTYLAAAREVADRGGRVTHLVDNYRSTPAVVAAYNRIFVEGAEGAADDRFFTGAIRYDHPVAAAADIEARGADDQPACAVELLQIVPPADDKLTADDIRAALLTAIVGEIRGLLHAPTHQLRFGRPDALRPLGAGDIFVLTRSNAESSEIADALRAAGIPCVLYKQEGLFQTREAAEIRDLLAGIAEPRDRSARFRALSTRFFALTLADLPRLEDLPESHPLLVQLYEWKARAERLDYEALLPSLITDSRLIERELLLSGSERALTNYQHILERLLESVTASRCELHELITRLEGWIAGGVSVDDDDLQRLESDAEAVQVMSIHRAKGLEAGAVFLYGGLVKGPTSGPSTYHADGRRYLWVGSRKIDAGVGEAIAREGDEEDERLLYVALTRAVARLYLPLVATEDYTVNGAYRAVNQRLQEIAAACRAGAPEVNGLFSVRELSGGHRSPGVPAPATAAETLEGWRPPAALVADVPSDPRFAEIRASRRGPVITSYTRMKRHHDAPLDAQEFKSDIDVPGVELPADAMPGGAEAGIFLHEILEYVPMASLRETEGPAPDDLDARFAAWRARPDVQRIVGTAMLRHDRDPRHRSWAERVVFDALTSPIELGDTTIDGLYRASADARELEFLYPIPGAVERGFIKGFIDLVFEHQGRLYALDYKSDILPDYGAAAIAAHVGEAYGLQLELYSLALARLAGIADDADHQARFGGLVYLFLRGGPASYVQRMSPAELRGVEERLAALEVVS